MHEPEGYDCPFCRIAAGEWPERVVHRDTNVMVIVNIRWWPDNPGAVLVVPIAHHENVYALPPELGTPIQHAIRDTALALKAAYGCDGVSTRQHNEPAGNQDVWHHHTHVFPRYAGDDLYRSRGAMVDDAEVERAAALLREHYPKPDVYASLAAKFVAAASVIRDGEGRILIVRPTYRETWGMPGGAVEAEESPKDGCAREIREELGLELDPGDLLCVEHRIGSHDSLRFLFAGPVLTAEQIDAIVLPPDELSEHRFVSLDEAVELLDPPLGRRLRRAIEHRGEGTAVYLENGELR